MKRKTIEQQNGELAEEPTELSSWSPIVSRHSNEMDYKRANTEGNKHGKAYIQTSTHAHTCCVHTRDVKRGHAHTCCHQNKIGLLIVLDYRSPCLQTSDPPLIWHNFANSQRLLIIFGRAIPVLHFFSQLTLADYNYDPVQSILIIFSRLFVNDHKSCLVVKFSTSPHPSKHTDVKPTSSISAVIDVTATSCRRRLLIGPPSGRCRAAAARRRPDVRLPMCFT